MSKAQVVSITDEGDVSASEANKPDRDAEGLDAIIRI